MAQDFLKPGESLVDYATRREADYSALEARRAQMAAGRAANPDLAAQAAKNQAAISKPKIQDIPVVIPEDKKYLNTSTGYSQNAPYYKGGYGGGYGSPLDSNGNPIAGFNDPVSDPNWNPNNPMGGSKDTNIEDVYSRMLSDTLGINQGQEDLLAKQYAKQQKISSANVAKQLEDFQVLLDLQYAPQFSGIDEGAAKTITSSNLGSAGSGSVRGTRQEGVIVDINEKAAQAKSALEAQKQAQLALAQATFMGAEQPALDKLQAALTKAQDVTRSTQQSLELAKQGALEAQITAAANAEAAIQEQLLGFFEDQGFTVNPLTGEVAGSLKGEKERADIQKTLAAAGLDNANIEKIIDGINNPNLSTSFQTDNAGNVTAIISNPKTGAMELVSLGGIGGARVGGGGGGGYGGYGGYGSTGVDGVVGDGSFGGFGSAEAVAAAAANEGYDVLEIAKNRKQFATDAGLTDEESKLALAEMFKQSADKLNTSVAYATGEAAKNKLKNIPKDTVTGNIASKVGQLPDFLSGLF